MQRGWPLRIGGDGSHLVCVSRPSARILLAASKLQLSRLWLCPSPTFQPFSSTPARAVPADPHPTGSFPRSHPLPKHRGCYLGFKAASNHFSMLWLLPAVVSAERIHRIGNTAALLLVILSPLEAVVCLLQAQNLGPEQLTLVYSPQWSSLMA